MAVHFIFFMYLLAMDVAKRAIRNFYKRCPHTFGHVKYIFTLVTAVGETFSCFKYCLKITREVQDNSTSHVYIKWD